MLLYAYKQWLYLLLLEVSIMHERENRILAFWKENDVFQKSLNRPSPKGNFVFYDGPPYATGLPHYGHVLPTTVKDAIPRYKTMRGYNVPRRWGWDCHGLPIENLIEKKLGLKNKKDIEEVGVGKFNKEARESVLTYADEWKQIIPRLGRWVDMDNDYRTMDASYMESVMWSFSELNKKGLVYEGYKVMPFCPRCGTSLSNFEVAQGYKDITDISAFVKFELKDELGTYVLAWTTTPWTLPGNVALAVNADLDYAKVEFENSTYWVTRGLIEKVFGTLEGVKILEETKGSALVGKSYLPVFPYYVAKGTMVGDNEDRRDNAWKIYAGDFVTAEDGTGIVHIAPAFGEDDMNLARKENLPVIHHVGTDGLFVPAVIDFAGQSAKPIDDHQKGDIEIIKYLAHKHGDRETYIALFKKEKYIHSYPHCWRCNTPLLNYATSSWFVKITDLKDRLVEENKKITWVPKEIGEGRFGKWLEGARDWAVSRSRYWGSPIPVWKGEKTGKTEFISSIEELKEKIRKDGRGNEFFVMRHGQATCNLTNTISSKKLDESVLTDLGKEEVRVSAEAMKARLGPVDNVVIYASDFSRTKETAEIVAGVIGYEKTNIIFDERLREINAGDFDGSDWGSRTNYFNNLFDHLYKPVPNGESVEDVKKRIAEFFYDIETKHKSARVLVVTHGLPLRLSLNVAKGMTMRDLTRYGWADVSDPTASVHVCDFVPLPCNESFELDLHRPYIDAVTWKNDTGEIMRRVPEVFDVWYDSGSMSFAQNHYPFEHKEEMLAENSAIFPADFIAEGLDQTRGWFYSLLNLSKALFDKSAYKNVIVNGLILAEDGRKMSKSLNNYPDLLPTVEKYGADALRYFLISSPAVHGEEVAFSEKSLDEVNKKLFNRLENVYVFYNTYATGDVSDGALPKNNHVLDKWIVSELNKLISNVTTALDAYQLDKAARPIADFIDELSTWYLRRSRDRFKGEDEADKQEALATTRYVLATLAKIMAPFVPFIAEEIYQKVKPTNAALSVHLEDWPEPGEVDSALLDSMSTARKFVEAGLALRSKAGIKVRQPLATFTYDGSVLLTNELAAIIADELNVKKVEKGNAVAMDLNITPELKSEGQVRELMRAVQEMRKNAGLSPSDEIVLNIETDSVGKNVIEAYSAMFTKAVQATSIVYGPVEAEEIHADGLSAKIAIVKGRE